VRGKRREESRGKREVEGKKRKEENSVIVLFKL
jgi:hypothetical protein